MPYKISKHDGKYFVKKKSGKVVATTDSYKNLKGVLWHREHGEGRGGFEEEFKKERAKHIRSMKRGDLSPPISGPHKGKIGHVNKELAERWAFRDAMSKHYGEGRGSGTFDYYLADNWMGRGGDGKGGTPPPGHHGSAFWKNWAKEEHKSDTAEKNKYFEGEKAVERKIPSETTPGKTYRVWGEKGNMHCSCPSFTYRNTCKHVQSLGEEGPQRKLKYGRNFYYKNQT